MSDTGIHTMSDTKNCAVQSYGNIDSKRHGLYSWLLIEPNSIAIWLVKFNKYI